MSWKLILCSFEPYLLLNFKAPVAETWICASLKIVSLESMINSLSVDALLVGYVSRLVRWSEKQVFSSCLVEWNVKVNIMLFRTLCFIEFQGSCSKYLNLGQSKNCVFGIYHQYDFCGCLTGASPDLSVEVKSRFFQLFNRKNVKVNIMLFRTLCSIEIQGPMLQKLELTTVWKLYFCNLRSIRF
jgi:hypothetical protein